MVKRELLRKWFTYDTSYTQNKSSSFTSTETATFTATFTPSFTPSTHTTPPPGIFSNAAFTNDGDGKRVKSEISTNLGMTTTYFIGAYYEVIDTGAGTLVNKYYYAGSLRIVAFAIIANVCIIKV